MFAKKTLIIVGAGASKEVGLPTGEDLASEIAAMLEFRFDFGRLVEGDSRFFGILQRLFTDNRALNDHLHVTGQIAEGICNAASVDNYIDTHANDPRVARVGKAAIIYKILQKERDSRLRLRASPEERMDFGGLSATWYPRFGRILRDGIPLTGIQTIFENIKIISFNYDRCIEHFLGHWIASIYGPTVPLGDLMSKLEILRPYGSVAPLSGNRAIKYGFDPTVIPLASMIENIKTYTEQVTDVEVLTKVHAAISEAETILFLGFGFHKQNINLLTPPGFINAHLILGTASGFSRSDVSVIQDDLHGRFKGEGGSRIDVELRHDLTCTGLFEEYKRTLSA